MITVYLDTALWNDLAEGRVDGSRFEQAISERRVVPVLSFIHLMEFAQTDPRYRRAVTDYIDRVTAGSQPLWIKPLPPIAKAELTHAFLRFIGIDSGPIEIFTHALVDALTADMPGLDKAEARTYNVTRLVEVMSGLVKFKRHQWYRKIIVVSQIAKLQYLRFKSRSDISPRDTEYVGNILTDLPGYLTTPNGVRIEMLSEIREKFLSQLRWENCPAVSLRVAMMRGLALKGGRGVPSDFEDLFHVCPPLAYCDVTFGDKKTYVAIERGCGFKLPRKNGEFAVWASSL